MLLPCLLLVLFQSVVQSLVRNESCPVVTPRELNWKELDGKWYVVAIASDTPVDGDCATVVFNHKTDNTTDMSVSWINNSTASSYNGYVQLVADQKSNGTGDLLVINYTDNKSESYSFLDVNYENYAVMFACTNDKDGNSSTYEIWKLIRSQHLKDDDAAKLDAAIVKYNLQDTVFKNFNNTEDSCRVNAAYFLHPSTLLMSSATALMLMRKLY